jgi:hypothetical protein
MASPRKETGADYRVGGVKNNSPMVEKDLERRVKKLNIFYTL